MSDVEFDSDISAEALSLWKRYVALAEDFHQTQRTLLRKCGFAAGDTIVEILRHALRKCEEKDVALELVRIIQPEAQQELFDELLTLAADRDIGSINRAEQILLLLPRPWLAHELKQSIERFLENVDTISPELLDLFSKVDNSLARQLAAKAASSEDASRRDLGEFFLKKLNQESSVPDLHE